MRSREFIREFDFAQTQKQRSNMDSPLKNWALNTLGDVVSIIPRSRYRSECNAILARIKQTAQSQIAQLIRGRKPTQQDAAGLARVLSSTTLQVSTSTEGDHTRMDDSVIVMDPWNRTTDINGVTWTIAHELGHILHQHWYKTYETDMLKNTQSGERFADDIATRLCRAMGISKAVAFKPKMDPWDYSDQTNPWSAGQSPDQVHPSLRDRIDSAGRQGLELSKPGDAVTQQPGMATATA
jgi:hypothetical protein